MRAAWGLAAAALITGTAVASDAGRHARACSQAAEFRWPARQGIRACTKLLADRALPPRERSAALVNRGIVRMQANDITAAIADYDAALLVDPALAEALVNKGIAYLAVGRERDAVELLTAGLARGPGHPEIAYYMRGRANELIGEVRAAYEDYSQAAALAPGWAEPSEELRRFSVVCRRTAAG